MPPFVSHAQNFEDVMLWRALGRIEAGFYIDVGAHSPAVWSVTRAFYERGWHGLNIEPNPALLADLVAARPRDVNLGVAIGDRAGTQEMTFAGSTGLSTLDPGQGKRLAEQGRPLTHASVAVRTLDDIWATHVPAGQEVHFLKVDVEGYELQVMRSADWRVRRPWIMVIEATVPQTAEPAFDAWEPILAAAAYRFAYADGLNRFYVAVEHVDLLGAFSVPPNVFDGFVVATEGRALERAARAEAAMRAMRDSRSWRITAPLRAASAITSRISRRR